MVPLSVVVCSALLALASSIELKHCPDEVWEAHPFVEKPDISRDVKLPPCNKPPCRLKVGTNQTVSIAFTAKRDGATLWNNMYLLILNDTVRAGYGDEVSRKKICGKIHDESGKSVPCKSVKAGTKYVYKDTFPIRFYSIYPEFDLTLHWEIRDIREKNLCFRLPVKMIK